MRVFVYEFVSGGGTFNSADEHGPSGSLLREGLAMLRAVAADFVQYADVRCLWDHRLPDPRMDGVHLTPVTSAADERCHIQSLAEQCDATLLIAPEFDGLLVSRARWVEDAGGRLLGPDSRFIELTSDKLRTSLWLRKSGVPVPETVEYLGVHDATLLAPPLVIKPNDGAGSTKIQLVEDRSKVEQIAEGLGGRICLQSFCPGQPISVSVLCGSQGYHVLPPFIQHVEPPDFRYAGGSRLTDANLIERAAALADGVVHALPATRGFFGIDLVLGPSSVDDYVIEVNPRLTTSYVGLRRVVRENLAEAMNDCSRGARLDLSYRSDPIEFLASGEILESNSRREGSGLP